MKKIIVGILIFSSASALAVFTELSVSYTTKKTTFDADNYIDTKSVTGSISLYFMEKFAIELSYTEAVGVREEKLKSGNTVISQQTVVQKSQITGADLIWVIADKKSFVQPYIKGGMAHIVRYQSVKVDSLNTYTLEPDKAVAPSYGAGLKFAITETFNVKFSYDVWQTPIGGGQVTNDAAIRAGLSWIL